MIVRIFLGAQRLTHIAQRLVAEFFTLPVVRYPLREFYAR